MYSHGPTDADQLAQMRHLAILQRRESPPRCNPVSILVVVMSLGMVFIGLTMTVIAHWPGSTSIGENPLKIAGPVLLSVGSVLFIVGMILACFLNRKEKRRWAKSINNLAHSKLAFNQSASSLTGAKGVPKTGQRVDTSMKGSQFDSHYPPAIGKVPPESSDSQRYGSFSYTDDVTDNGRKIGLMQSQVDSFGAVTQRQQYAVKLGDYDEEDAIPDPIRAKKIKNLDSSSENLKTSERKELLSKGELGQMKLPNYSASDEEVFNISVEDDPNIPGAVRKKKNKKTTKSSRENLNAPEAEELLSGSRTYQKGSQVVEETSSHFSTTRHYQVSYEDEQRDAKKPVKAKPTVPAKPVTASQLQQQPSPGEARRLRVHVRTQPGATVHIHKGTATPPQSAFGPVNKSSGSGETDL